VYEFVRSAASGPVERFAFPSNAFVLGSDLGADVRLEGLRPHHAEVSVDASGGISLRDLSGGHTAVDGRLVTVAALRVGARLRLGALELEVGVHDGLPGAFPEEAFAATSVRSGELPAVAGTHADADSLRPGDVVAGRYRIARLLARGGMGEVYQAEHLEQARVVALKVMLASLSGDPQFVTRFQAEAIAAGRIGSPHIVEVLDSGQTADGRFYYAMEFLEGRTLTELLTREAPLEAARAAAIASQVGHALNAAHREGIVHRDLKPDNVMLVERAGQAEFVKVVDFGVAKVGQAASHTAVGALIGTPLYMSPEQARGEPVDQRADIYSLGLMLHEMLTGKPTFPAANPFLVLERQIRDPAPPLPDSVPGALRELVGQMLQKEADARPRSIALVVAQLEQVANAPQRRRSKWVVALTAVLVAGALVFTTVALQPEVPLSVPPSEATPVPMPEKRPVAVSAPLPSPEPAIVRPPRPKASLQPESRRPGEMKAPGSHGPLLPAPVPASVSPSIDPEDTIVVTSGEGQKFVVSGLRHVESQDPDIADVHVTKEDDGDVAISVVGKRAGFTTVFIDAAGQRTSRRVHVVR
jgi:serine/threonine protein kinase